MPLSTTGRQLSGTKDSGSSHVASTPPNDVLDSAPTDGPSRKCFICDETLSSDGCYLNCNHAAKICRECFSKWLTAQIGTVAWNSIRCSSTGCMTIVPHNIVKDYAPPDVFAQ